MEEKECVMIGGRQHTMVFAAGKDMSRIQVIGEYTSLSPPSHSTADTMVEHNKGPFLAGAGGDVGGWSAGGSRARTPMLDQPLICGNTTTNGSIHDEYIHSAQTQLHIPGHPPLPTQTQTIDPNVPMYTSDYPLQMHAHDQEVVTTCGMPDVILMPATWEVHQQACFALYVYSTHPIDSMEHL